MPPPLNSTRELHGRRAVVTGSSTGIGRAIALELAAAGADVAIHYCRSQADATQSAQIAAGHGSRVTTIAADLSSADGCAKLIDDAWQWFGGCDIWVNNAGADILTGADARLPFE